MNSNDNTTSDIKLTDAELELIRIKRQKEEIEKQQILAELEIKKAEAVSKEKKIFNASLEKSNKINELTTKLCEELNKISNTYAIFTLNRKLERTASLYINDKEREALNLDAETRNIDIETFTQEYEDFFITRPELPVREKTEEQSKERSLYDYQVYVSIQEHYTSSGSYSYSTSKFAGYKYVVAGSIIRNDTDSRKKYTKAESVHNVIQDAIDSAKRQSTAAELNAIAKENCITFLKKQYPEAKEIKEDSFYYSNHGSVNVIKVSFVNNLKVYYKYNYDGKTFDFPVYKMDVSEMEKSEEIINVLKNI